MKFSLSPNRLRAICKIEGVPALRSAMILTPAPKQRTGEGGK
jgi:hypothetical protein